ncbi:hypothetical protein M1B72_13140 [Geomonas paludis]|uniref:Porin domain-containing protein n=1 Tax=Geomonas paludis TaxID=2740185 RepID=A0A6V8MWE5_9BACT|nr:hypothetical protein [Geomonas paludis]UPU34396.1 hypothetical protein M1B72_13140 [Geomonas paludis]GFO64381.1 hypothetical protein GMPD_23000 [Geomonas paludis]
MKKIIALSACLIMVSSSMAFAANAALNTGGISHESATIYGGVDATDAASASGTLIGKLSKSVKVGVRYTTTTYALDTKHTSGNTKYGTAFDATAIYKQETSTGALDAAPTTADSGAFSSWTAM